MNERERTALAEAIEHCAMHNSEYQHYTPAAKIAEWQNVLGESISAAQLDAAVTEGERDASGQAESPAATAAREMLRYPSRYDAPAGLLSSDALHSRPPGLESGVAVREPYRAGPAGFKLAEHRARILETSDPLLRDLLHFRCSDPACEATTRVRLEMRVPRDTLPTPGPCPACKAPMALIGRAQLQSAEERQALDDHEASG